MRYFLVLDRNGNGLIDNGTELFVRRFHTSGRRRYGDGWFCGPGPGRYQDAGDARFASLRIWRDLNGDGVSQSNELFTLSSLGLAVINVTKIDGSTASMGTSTMGDVDLAENTFVSQFIESIPITLEVAALPNANGSGQVRNM